jgi:hypothetical protein
MMITRFVTAPWSCSASVWASSWNSSTTLTLVSGRRNDTQVAAAVREHQSGLANGDELEA